MLSLVQGDVLNKKTALDRVMATSSFDGRQLGKAARLVTATLNCEFSEFCPPFSLNSVPPAGG